MVFTWIRKKLWERERAIYRYWDGKTIRAIDPMQAWRELDGHPTFNWETHPQEAARGDWESQQLTIKAIRDVFGILPMMEGGLLESETLAVLTEFVLYIDALKKNFDQHQTSPEFTEPEFSDQSITNAASDSGSTSTVPKQDAPPVC